MFLYLYCLKYEAQINCHVHKFGIQRKRKRKKKRKQVDRPAKFNEKRSQSEREKKTKGDIFCCRKNMKFCSDGMLAATRVKMSDSEKKSEQEHVRHFLHKTCNQEVSGGFTLQSSKTTAKKCTNKVCYTCKVAFLLIRPISVFSPFSLPSPLSITRCYILFEQTIIIIESFAFSAG